MKKMEHVLKLIISILDDIHNQEKTTCPKIQIISYHPSMIDINIIGVIDYHEILPC